MCGCSAGKNNKPVMNHRQVINNPTRNITPPQQQQNIVPPKVTPFVPQQQKGITPPRNIVPNKTPMTPDRKRIERLQREAIRRSLGK